MSRFYASIEGTAKTPATRQGTTTSGISGHIRGWGKGVRVTSSQDLHEDIFEVYATGGSNGGGEKYIGCLVDGVFIISQNAIDDGIVQVLTD